MFRNVNVLFFFLVVSGGCATQSHQILKPLGQPKLTACTTLYEKIDTVVADYGVGNAGETRIAGFPFLRTNRLLASFQPKDLNLEQKATWLWLMSDLDVVARRAEIDNLPLQGERALAASITIPLGNQLENCRRTLTEHLVRQPRVVEHALADIHVPENYATWQRVVGLYYLTSLPVVLGIDNLREEIATAYAVPLDEMPVKGKLIHLSPPNQKPDLSADQLAEIITNASNNPLSMPDLSQKARDVLFDFYAPEWLLDVVENNDRVGEVYYPDNDQLAAVNTANPTVYRRLSHTRYDNEILLQLNYIVWFPARTTTSVFDILGGHLDGIMWRVTLDKKGQPLIHDSVHNCGCYHLFFPTDLVTFMSREGGIYEELPLSPQVVQRAAKHERQIIRVAQFTHFVERVGTQLPNTPMVTGHYQFAEYESLESLAFDNRYKSLFTDDGLVAGTERAERFLLWPMGIPSPGAMRQWGTHATAFLGKRHFDDPWLLQDVIQIK